MMSSIKSQAISPLTPPKSPSQLSLSAPKWRTTSPVPLNRENFLALLNGQTPMIKIPSFISMDLSQRTAEHLMPNFAPYLHATGPAVEKVGLAQFEFQAQSEEDFKNRDGKGQLFLDLSLPGFCDVVLLICLRNLLFKWMF
jgi:hypothetical protein